MQARVRFAPSPTGYLHVGNARTALMNWLFAQKVNGVFILRLDDTDLERSNDMYAQAIKDDLQWLGLGYDETFRQTERMDSYKKSIEFLKKTGRIYPCYESEEELAFKRKLLLSKGLPPIYDRSSLSLSAEEKKALESKGIIPHWRFFIEDKPIVWNDLVRGCVSFDGSKLSDPILIRADQSPVYTLSSVVDDIDYGITHILRAEDHVANTAIQIQAFEALGKNPQDITFAHPPLIADQEGGGLSKRLGSLALREMRENGILPCAITSLLGRLGTCLPIMPFARLQDLVPDFDFATFGRSTPKFSLEELLALNKKILHTASYEDVKPYLRKEDNEVFWQGVQTTLTTLKDLSLWHTILEHDVVVFLSSEEKRVVKEGLDSLKHIQPFNWKEWIDGIKKTTSFKGRALFMPLRRALTGQDHGPELEKIIQLLGEKEIIKRMESALNA